MKYHILFSIIIFLFIVKPVLGDSPPSFREFERYSENKQFVAVVEQLEEDSLKKPAFSRWTMTVYKINSDSRTLRWKSDYKHPGYSGGYLSNDGMYLVYLEYWFYEKEPLVTIYKEGKVINSASITGASFNIPENLLVQTVSHQIWQAENKEHGFESRNNKLIFRIETIDKKKHYLDLDLGTFLQQ